MTIVVAGASGTIGHAVVQALLAEGRDVACLQRGDAPLPPGAKPIQSDYKAISLPKETTAVISCIASRSGVPADAWAVDHDANLALLQAAQSTEATRFLLLSAICVQKPKLAFQHAKRAFEAKLRTSDFPHTIVHPTAYFKSLSGQVERVKSGKPYLVFGDGKLTSCKPISDRDLAQFIIQTLTDPDAQNQTRPIGGPGPAITPLDQAHHLFELLGRPPKIRHVPLGVMRAIAGGLSAASHILPSLKPKAELAKIGLYYASESMLTWDAARQRYDAAATPEFGSDTYFDHLADLVAGRATTDLGAHRMFEAAGRSRASVS